MASGRAERQKVYSDCRMKRVFRSSMTRLYVRFILSFKKEWSMSAYVFCGISINISSTEAARFLGNPILFANYLMDSYFFSRFKEYNFLSVLYKKIIREDTSYFHFENFENPDRITTVRG